MAKAPSPFRRVAPPSEALLDPQRKVDDDAEEDEAAQGRRPKVVVVVDGLAVAAHEDDG